MIHGVHVSSHLFLAWEGEVLPIIGRGEQANEYP